MRQTPQQDAFLTRHFVLMALLLAGPWACWAPPASAGSDFPGGTFYVAVGGDDTTGNGSTDFPWATITHALDSVPDESLILVRAGTYTGRVRMRGTFPTGVTVRSETPYRALLRNNDRVVTIYAHPAGAEGITVEGFDIAHSGSGSAPLVFHIDGNGDNSVSRITVRDNIFHDSWDNDLLKINNAAREVLVEGNLFFNQSGSDEHIDINSVEEVVVQDNIFFNDFEASGRINNDDTGSFIVIKDSNGSDDIYVGSRFVDVRRNIFLNWQGSTGSNFLLLGEDGMPNYEARNIQVENNLFLGQSTSVLRAAFGVKGGQDIVFVNNTIVGDLPSLAFAMRLNREGANPVNDNLRFANNIWSDPTGTMGASFGGSNDFSDTPPADSQSVLLTNNLYWNGGTALPEDAGELVNPSDDASAVVADPELASQAGLVVPYWNSGSGTFADGSSSIRAAFVRLGNLYGAPASGSAAIGAADAGFAPEDDLFGAPRSANPNIGAVENGIFADGFESGDTSAWN